MRRLSKYKIITLLIVILVVASYAQTKHPIEQEKMYGYTPVATEYQKK